jgi:hypothetical protein
MTPVVLSDSTFNSVVEIEAALAKTSYSVPFNFDDANGGDQDMVIINTLPTRYEADSFRSGYPGMANGICNLQYRVYDMKETIIMDFLSGDVAVRCLPEVSMQPMRSIIAPGFIYGYIKGWVKVTLSTSGGFGLSAPGISDLSSALTYLNYIEGIPGYSNGNGFSYGQGQAYSAAIASGGTTVTIDSYPYFHGVTYRGVPSINSALRITSNNDMVWNYTTSPESQVTYYEDLDGDGRIDVAEIDANKNQVLDPIEDKDSDGVWDFKEDANGTGVNGTIIVRQ